MNKRKKYGIMIIGIFCFAVIYLFGINKSLTKLTYIERAIVNEKCNSYVELAERDIDESG